MHRRKWICEDHNIEFRSADLFAEHVSTMHALSVSQHQMPVLTELSERPCDDMEIHPCPLCPEERRLNALTTHLAEHLESLALFALSGNGGITDGSEDDRDDSIGSVGGRPPSTRHSESTTSEILTSSLLGRTRPRLIRRNATMDVHKYLHLPLPQ
jgi:hypothetical protein